MTSQRIADLKRVHVLSGISDAGLEWLAASCVWHHWEVGAQLLGHQDRSTEVYFITSGTARVVIYSSEGDAVVFQDLMAGGMFGEMSAIDGRPRSASIETITVCSAASLTARQFEALLLREATVAVAVVRWMVDNVRSLTERVHEYSTLVVQQRVQAELLRMCEQSGRKQSNGVLLSPAPSLAEIAGRISSHREAVSREVSRLAANGVLRREGTDLRVLEPARLLELVRTAKGG